MNEDFERDLIPAAETLMTSKHRAKHNFSIGVTPERNSKPTAQLVLFYFCNCILSERSPRRYFSTMSSCQHSQVVNFERLFDRIPVSLFPCLGDQFTEDLWNVLVSHSRKVVYLISETGNTLTVSLAVE